MADPIKEKNIIEVIGENEVPLKTVLSATSSAAVSRAWAAGEIEFGSRKHCTAGKPGKPGSMVIIEEGMEWSEPKTVRGHKPFAKFDASDELPNTEKYCRADVPRITQKDAQGFDVQVMPSIPRAQAVELLALHVRLSDKGTARLQVA